jgi:mRNA interferase RelE/StbE
VARYLIIIKRPAEKELSKVPQRDAARIAMAIDALADNPRPAGVKKLEGSADLWRIRIGDYRVIYTIEDRIVTVTVVRIGQRGDVYR